MLMCTHLLHHAYGYRYPQTHKQASRTLTHTYTPRVRVIRYGTDAVHDGCGVRRDALGLARLAHTLESYSHCRTPLTTFHTASTFGVYLPMRSASHVREGTLPPRPNARCEFRCESQARART